MAFTLRRNRLPAVLALVCALLFLAGSFAVAPGHPGPETVAPDGSFLAVQEAGAGTGPVPSAMEQPEPLQETSGRALYGTFWEENLGQWADPALWVLRGGATVALTRDGLLVPTADGVVRFEFVGGEGTSVQVVEALGSTTSVFGSESIVGARHAERLRMEAVWPGIDFDVYIASSGSLEYDFRVHPGADPAMARMEVTGVVPVLEDGRLVLGGFSFQAPRSFQGEASVPSHFVLDGQTVGVEVGAYDPAQMLVIDPTLEYGTLLAPMYATTVHRVYGTKQTEDGLFFAGSLYEPATSTWHPRLTQTIPATGSGDYVGFFVHLHPVTKELLSFVELRSEHKPLYSWSSVFTFAYGIDVDAEGKVYLVGQTGSYDWGLNLKGIPVVGGEDKKGYGYFDGYVARFAPADGGYDLDFSTHVGGNYMYSYYDSVNQVIVNPDQTFWVAGVTHDKSVYPAALATVVDSTASPYYPNIFAMRFTDEPVPQAELFTTFGGNSYMYNVLSGADTDAEGNLYFVGSNGQKQSWLPSFPTTADALQPASLGNYDHFYGKFNTDGSIGHLSYWGTKGYDDPATYFGGLGGPGITVLGKDEIVIAGTVGGCCVPFLSKERLTQGGYGSYDAYLSHIHLDKGVVFSTHLGSSGMDFAGAVAYDHPSATYFVGGTSNRPIEPDILFADPVPRATHNGRYDAYVTAIQRARIDPAQPLDQQESMVVYTMYVGNQVGDGSSISNRVYDLELFGSSHLLVGGNQGGSWDIADAASTTVTAIDNGPGAGLYNTAFFQQLNILNGLDIVASDELGSAATPDDDRFDTRTLTDVHLVAQINATILRNVALSELSWDLDGDDVFEDAFGGGIHLIRRDHEETVEVCVQAPPAFPTAPPVETCMEIFFANRQPVVVLELLDEPAGFLDPLPFYKTGRGVWIDGALSFDPEGRIDYETITWIPEVRDAAGDWVPDQDVQLGGAASLAVQATYSEPGMKRMSLVLGDELGATERGSLAIMVVGQLPVVECAFGGPVRMDRWIDVDVIVSPADSPLTNWTLAPGMGLPALHGTGAPPPRIRTLDVLPAVGEGTATLTVRDEGGAEGSCSLGYVAGPRMVTADFTWGEASAGQLVAFTDHSFPDVPERPIVTWEWRVDGLVVSTDRDTSHVFAHAGSYMVSLTVTDGHQVDTYSVPVDVAPAPSGPTARIGVASPPYVAGEEIGFTDESSAGASPIVAWSWDFGFEEVAQDASVVLPAGSHVVRLVVTDAQGLSDETEVSIRVADAGEVIPEFTASVLEPSVGEAVRFMDVSRTGPATIEAREWSFSDGSRAAQGAVVDHVFWQPGTYDVTLTLFDSEGGRHAVTHGITVSSVSVDTSVGPASREALLPVADAGVDRRVQVGSVVLLDAAASTSHQSQGMTASWRQVGGPQVELVPDGLGASLRVPYAPGEVVSVELVVADAQGVSDPDIVRLHVVSEHADGLGQVAAPDADFSVERTDRLVRLSAPTHPVDARYLWDLGDGTVMEAQEVVHEYDAHDQYPVRLTIRDVHGQETTHQETIQVRSSDDIARPQTAAAKAWHGAGLQDLLITGVLVAAGAAAAAFVVRRK